MLICLGFMIVHSCVYKTNSTDLDITCNMIQIVLIENIIERERLSALPVRQSTTKWYQSHGSKSGTRGLTIDIYKNKK